VRTSIRLDDDVTAAARRLQQTEKIGFGQAVNRLARRGADRADARTAPYARPVPLRSLGGSRFDLTDTEDVIDLLEGPTHK